MRLFHYVLAAALLWALVSSGPPADDAAPASLRPSAPTARALAPEHGDGAARASVYRR